MRFSSWLKAWFWPDLVIVTVFVLTVIPMPQETARIPFFDKIGHILYTGLIATVLVRQVRPWKTIVAGICLSIGIELIQYFLPWRECEAADAICGSVGTVLAVVLYRARWYRETLELRLW